MPKKDYSNAVKKTEKVEKVVEVEEVDVEDESPKKNLVKKPGRTLLVSTGSGSSMDDSVVSGLTGLTKSFSTKNGSYFLTFDTIENSVINHKKLRQDHPNLKVKFASYQIFITLKNLKQAHDYTAVKKMIIDYVQEKTGGEVLYFKLYRKGDNYYFDNKGDEPIGYGDLTLDTKDAMDALLNKEGSLKECSLELKSGDTTCELTIKFYRFNKTPKNDTKNSSNINQV